MTVLKRDVLMSRTSAVVAAIAVAVSVGCSDTQATSPRLRPSGPSLSATQSFTRVTFFNSHTFFVPCLGEDARFYGLVTYDYHSVATSDGGFDYHLIYMPQTPNSPPFVAEGQSSGKVFYFQNGHPINVSFHAAAGEVDTFIDEREIYIADDGSSLHLLSGLHMTFNANGDLTVDHITPFSVECTAA